MKVTKEILEKYARLSVRTGMNVQPGQVVSITASVNQVPFTMMVAEECYLAGAKRVEIDWTCDEQTRLNFKYCDEDTLSTYLPWQIAKLEQKTKDLPFCRIFIDDDDPDALAGIDTQKLSNVSRRRAAVAKKFRDEVDGKNQWLIIAVPSSAWAKKCFPELSEEEAIEKLWDAILHTVHITEDNDPVAVWKEHVDFLNSKSAWLNEQHFTSLRYKSANGTDFTVGLISGAKWASAGMTNSLNDKYFIPNMPTEEVFTSPKAGKAEGTLVSTKALSWNGQLINNFSITFENGKAVSCKAEEGQELLEMMIHMDETSCMLGEVALVPKTSPVNLCGFLFYNTLFDENAVCHCALGMGFKEVLPDGDNITMAEAVEKYGINDSIIHVDFMVGSDDLEVVGIREDGSETQIFVNGNWA